MKSVINIPYGASYSTDKGIYTNYESHGVAPIPEFTGYTPSGLRDWAGDKITNIQETRQQKTFIEEEANRLIGFDPSKPVDFEGETYPGKDIQYTVKDFDPQFLHGAGVDTHLKGIEQTLTAHDYDIYTENMGKYFYLWHHQ